MPKINLLNKEQMLKVGNQYFIEFPEGATKPEMLAVLRQNNITQAQVDDVDFDAPLPTGDEPVVVSPTEGIITTADIVADEPEPVASATTAAPVQVETSEPDTQLLKYERQNNSFEILTYRFTREHPFQVVSSRDADYIVRNIPGFRPALASEAAEFYS